MYQLVKKNTLYFIFKVWVFVYILKQISPIKGEKYSLKMATTVEPSLKSMYMYLGETILRIGHWCKASEVKNFNQVAVSNRINFVMNSGYKFIILYEFLMFNLWKISTIACNFNADMKVIAKVKTIYLKIARNIGPS